VSARHIPFALGMAGLGLLGVLSGDFPYSWQPVPQGIPWREGLACASGALLLTVGAGMLYPRTARFCAMVMTLNLLGWVLVLRSGPVFAAPRDVGVWLGVAENVILMCGAWTAFASPRAARILLGLACLVLGLSHFVYLDVTAGMIPRWLPWRPGLAVFTGTAHLAAGLGILFSVVPRLAATMEAAMIGVFVLLLHIPSVAAEPRSRLQWTMLSVAIALGGAVWNVAGCIDNREPAINRGADEQTELDTELSRWSAH
jgi:uncharacterized membrane protein